MVLQWSEIRLDGYQIVWIDYQVLGFGRNKFEMGLLLQLIDLFFIGLRLMFGFKEVNYMMDWF